MNALGSEMSETINTDWMQTTDSPLARSHTPTGREESLSGGFGDRCSLASDCCGVALKAGCTDFAQEGQT